jgi:hypothetical protein
MYYAFFPDSSAPKKNQAKPAVWSGEIELRGLAPGQYHVEDYVNGKDLGTVRSPGAKLKTSFADNLLIEVTRE